MSRFNDKFVLTSRPSNIAFFPRSVKDWNNIQESMTDADMISVQAFKEAAELLFNLQA